MHMPRALGMCPRAGRQGQVRHRLLRQEGVHHIHRDLSGRGTTRAEDAQGTPTQSHISPSVLVYADGCEAYASPYDPTGGIGICPGPWACVLGLDTKDKCGTAFSDKKVCTIIRLPSGPYRGHMHVPRALGMYPWAGRQGQVRHGLLRQEGVNQHTSFFFITLKPRVE